MFELHPQLQQDCDYLGTFPLCRLLLLRDANYPWCLLVPAREGVSEIYQLNESEQQQLQRESCFLSRCMAELFNADKMNVAAIGNMVPQLHVHHVVRYRDDAAWPAPVWGKVPALAYTSEELESVRSRLLAALGDSLGFLPFK